MRKASLVAAVLIVSLTPSSAYAWGAVAHRFIMSRAIDLLPPQLKPFFVAHRDEIVMRVNDPDLWRNVGWEDDPNHFVDFGAQEYGPYPFTALPREYGAALEKFGMTTVKRNGLLPWREAEEFGNLQRAFGGFARNGGFSTTDTILFAAVAAHYIQDAHQPFHASINYDGQLTGQSGVHARFESALFERYEATLSITPLPAKPITNPRDFAFDTLLASYQLVETILAADKAAIAGKDTYDDQYFDTFFAAVKPTLERRLADSISATAGLIIGAWEQAGKPELKTMPRLPQKVKKPSSVQVMVPAAEPVPLEIALDRREHSQDQERNDRRGGRDREFAGAGGHTDRRVHPNRRGRGHAVDGRATAQDRAASQESNPRHNLRGDTIGRAAAVPARQVDRDDREQRRSDRDQHVGAQPRGLLADLALDTDRCAQSGGEQQTQDQICWRHRDDAVVYCVTVGADDRVLSSPTSPPQTT